MLEPLLKRGPDVSAGPLPNAQENLKFPIHPRVRGVGSHPCFYLLVPSGE